MVLEKKSIDTTKTPKEAKDASEMLKVKKKNLKNPIGGRTPKKRVQVVVAWKDALVSEEHIVTIELEKPKEK